MYRQRFFVPRKSNVHPTIAIDDLTIIEGMRQSLKDHVQQRFSSLRLAMKAMLHSHSSQNTDSKVSLFAFRKFLKTVGVAASIQESHGLFDYLDHDKDGWLDFNDLVASLGTLANNVTHKQAAMIKTGSPTSQIGNFKTQVDPAKSSLIRSYSSMDTLRPPTSSDTLRPERGHGLGTSKQLTFAAGKGRGGGGGAGKESRPRTADLFLMRPKTSAK